MPKSIQDFEIFDYFNNTWEALLNNRSYFIDARLPLAYISNGNGYAHGYHPTLWLAGSVHECAVWLVNPSLESPNTQLRQKDSYLSRTAK